jgi:hypothetical protein
MEDYNTGKKICEKIYTVMCNKLRDSETMTTLELANYGLERLQKECNERCTVAVPPNVCLNNVISNYIGQDTITSEHVVKITLGVRVGESIYIHGDTFTKSTEGIHDVCTKALDKIASKVKKKMVAENTTDDVRIVMEKYASLNNVQMVENCTSYEHHDGMIKGINSKYIIANYVKYYDDDDIVYHPNDCFDLEKGEVYTVVLNVYSNDTNKFQVNTGDQVHLGYINKERYNLKLKSSREFYSVAKRKHGHDAFRLDAYMNVPKFKVGIKECIDNGILEPMYIETAPKDVIVYSKIFTVMIS